MVKTRWKQESTFVCCESTYTATLTIAFTHTNTTEHGKWKEHRGEKRVQTCSAVNHYTGAYEVEEMGVWEQRQPAGNIPPLLSVFQVKTVWKHSLTGGRGRGGGISEYQPISLRGIITVREPKQISSGPLARVDPILNLPSCPPGSCSPVH